MPTESYIDCGNRDAFEDQGGAMVLHPDFGAAIAAYASCEDCCLPWVVTGPALVAARRTLAQRARSLGATSLGQALARAGSRLLRRSSAV